MLELAEWIVFTIHHDQQLKISVNEMSNAAITIEAEISYSLEGLRA